MSIRESKCDFVLQSERKHVCASVGRVFMSVCVCVFMNACVCLCVSGSQRNRRNASNERNVIVVVVSRFLASLFHSTDDKFEWTKGN